MIEIMIKKKNKKKGFTGVKALHATYCISDIPLRSLKY